MLEGAKFTYFTQFFWSCLFFLLFASIYWVVVYLAIYINHQYMLYERTNESINRTWICIKICITDFTLARQDLAYFLKIGFLIASFGIFSVCYKLMFPTMEKDDLGNPIQVIAQLSCVLLNLKYPLKPERERHLLNLCFLFSVLSSLFLQGISFKIFFFFLLFSLVAILLFPLYYAHLFIFWGYMLGQGLAKWGFYLAFQQVCLYALTLLFINDTKSSSAHKKKRLFSFLALLIIQIMYGFLYYQDFYLMEPLKLAAILSGACIIFICISHRPKGAFYTALIIYFILSIIIGIMSLPEKKTIICGMPHGIFIFFFLHFWLSLAIWVFKDSLPQRKQPLVPFFFGGLFFLLPHFPELSWLEKWMEGMDLLLLIIGVYSFVEDEKSYKKRITKITQKWLNERKEKRTRYLKRLYA